jgi:hypothetical protein
MGGKYEIIAPTGVDFESDAQLSRQQDTLDTTTDKSGA